MATWCGIFLQRAAAEPAIRDAPFVRAYHDGTVTGVIFQRVTQVLGVSFQKFSLHILFYGKNIIFVALNVILTLFSTVANEQIFVKNECIC